jgi:glycosyltransferase involved in cell wall biosynthesis
MKTPSCSVVVSTRHRAELLARCLSALTVQEHPSYEVIVVDNTTGEQDVENLAAKAGARYIVESREGLSRARNAGARAAQGGIIAYIDDDAVAEPTWLSAHTAAFEDADLMATTGRVMPISLESPAAIMYAAAGGEDLGEVPFRVDRMTPCWFEMANFGGVGVGPNMAFRRALFEAGWGFRESLGPGGGIPGEEHYAFFTIIRGGHTIAYVPAAVVHHRYPATIAALRRRRFRILQGAAAYMVMLLVEEPEYRRDTLRYMAQSIRGVRRPWRRGHADARLATRLQLLAAACTGPPLYVRTRLATRGRLSRLPSAQPAGEGGPRQRSVSS